MFAGLLSKEVTVAAWGDPVRILATLAPFSLAVPNDYWLCGRQMLLQVNTKAGAESAAIYQHLESGVAVVFWGRLDSREDLIGELSADVKAGNDELIALAWLKWGESSPEHLIGEFALAIADPRAGKVFIARDVMGVKPLFYRTDAHGVFFANSVEAFKPLQLGTMTPSRRWMAAFLIDLSYSHTETAYEEIKKLPGAHSLLIHADGRINLRRYHRFAGNAPVERTRNPHWLEAYKTVWQEAVACRIPAQGPIGCENSGGLDSGSITAETARQLGDGIDRLHGMGFCHEALEPEYIMATAMRWSMKNNNLFSHDTGLDLDCARPITVSGYPQEHGNGASHYPFYELCRQNGIGTLLSGFGGDEAVTYPGRVPARLELLTQGNWRGLWRSLPGSPPMRLGRFAKTVRTAMRMPKQNADFIASWQERWPHHFLSSEALEEFGLESDYFASATYDERFRTINDAVLYLLSRPFLPTRLENCSLMASTYGIEYAWPLLDQRLVQQWLSTPAIWKVGDDGIGRFLHRSAVNGVCADKVAWKVSKDMGYTVVSNIAESADNRPLFKKALLLIGSVPSPLAMIVDVVKVRRMAEQGIREDWRGQSVRTAWSTNINQLELAKKWLEKS